MTQKEIKGVIFYEVASKEYKFGTHNIEWYENGVWLDEYAHYILVCEHTIIVDIPADFDTVTPQLSALDAKEKELKIQYHQALEHIKVQRNNLLAIEA